MIALSDSSGTIATDYRYDAFGNQLTQNANDTNPFRYCGEYFDSETQNIYLRNRYYDPSNGRFITEDPIRDGLNWYVYCGSNPVMFVDPIGLRNIIIMVGLETNNGSVFMDDANTFMSDNQADDFVLLDARDYIDYEKPLDMIMNDVAYYSNEFNGIDAFVFFGHSQPDALLVFWEARKELSFEERFITSETDWSYINFNANANIKFAGCNTAGYNGKKYKDTIAQDIADKTGMTAWGYVWSSYQKKKGNGYYQVPDSRDGTNKDYVRVGTDRIRIPYPYAGEKPYRWMTISR